MGGGGVRVATRVARRGVTRQGGRVTRRVKTVGVVGGGRGGGVEYGAGGDEGGGV